MCVPVSFPRSRFQAPAIRSSLPSGKLIIYPSPRFLARPVIVGNRLTITANGGIIGQFVQQRVTEGGYSSVSEYVRELIRADQKRKVEERIDTLLLEGLDSGQPIPVTSEYWEEKKRRLTERLSKAIHPQ
jgi:antitoxin ParD1/3/4